MRADAPRANRVATRIAALAFTFLLGACFLDTGACNYEHRTLVLRGSVTGLAGVEVSLNETRGNSPDFRVLNLQVTSGPVSGVVLSAALQVVGTDAPQLLAAWPTGSASGELWSANVDLADATPSHEMLASLARAGRLQVTIRTGPPSAPTERRGFLAVSTDGDWRHPRCD